MPANLRRPQTHSRQPDPRPTAMRRGPVSLLARNMYVGSNDIWEQAMESWEAAGQGAGKIQSFSASWEGLRLCLLPFREESITVANSSKSTSLLHPPHARQCSSATSMPETRVIEHRQHLRMTDCTGTPFGVCGIIERGKDLPSASMRLKRRSSSSSLFVCHGLSSSVTHLMPMRPPASTCQTL